MQILHSSHIIVLSSKAPFNGPPQPSRQLCDRQSWHQKMSTMQLDLELTLRIRARFLMRYRKKVMECEQMRNVSSPNRLETQPPVLGAAIQREEPPTRVSRRRSNVY
jgi:hypothetical protein